MKDYGSLIISAILQTMEKLIQSSKEELTLCPGLGPQKVCLSLQFLYPLPLLLLSLPFKFLLLKCELLIMHELYRHNYDASDYISGPETVLSIPRVFSSCKATGSPRGLEGATPLSICVLYKLFVIKCQMSVRRMQTILIDGSGKLHL